MSFLSRFKSYLSRSPATDQEKPPSLEEWKAWGERSEHRILDLLDGRMKQLDSIPRHLRRLALQVEQLEHQMASVNQEEEPQWLEALGLLHQVAELFECKDVAYQKLEQVQRRLYELSSLKPLAVRGETVQGHQVEIVDAIASDAKQAGTIIKILQQGYLRSDGSMVRSARVVVGKGVNYESTIRNRLGND